MRAAAEATAILEQQKRARRDALRDVLEGRGANYVKAVIYQDDGGEVKCGQPKHVLLYLFEPGEAGERVGAEWLSEARQRYRGLAVSVYMPCAFALAGLPVVGAAKREKPLRQVRLELARSVEDERAEVA